MQCNAIYPFFYGSLLYKKKGGEGIVIYDPTRMKAAAGQKQPSNAIYPLFFYSNAMQKYDSSAIGTSRGSLCHRVGWQLWPERQLRLKRGALDAHRRHMHNGPVHPFDGPLFVGHKSSKIV
jgi:hypothetical protein